MSKYELRSKAHTLSGVTYDQSLLASTALTPTLLERIGGPDGFHLLATLFYKRVFADKSHPWFLGIFASSTKSEAIDNQHRFLVQTFGGPELYKEKKGKYTRLVGRHANYKIGAPAAERWMHHMERAIDEHESLQGDEEKEAREYLKMYFRYTAFYIVAASEYMRDDQLSGERSSTAGGYGDAMRSNFWEMNAHIYDEQSYCCTADGQWGMSAGENVEIKDQF